jgi:hypothetical protein
MIRLFALPFKILVALASSNSGDKIFFDRFAVQTTTPSGWGGEQKRMVAASPVINKCQDPSWVKQLPENGLVKLLRRDTGPQPRRNVRRKSAAPFSGAEEQNARAISAYAQYAYLLS